MENQYTIKPLKGSLNNMTMKTPSTEHDDGGPAFPQPMTKDVHGNIVTPSEYGPFGGMSLRDWFAGQALQAIIKQNGQLGIYDDKEAACEAFRYADAMLAAREERQ